MALKTYAGGCHCGAVRFEVEVDLSQGSNRCNCSICSKARAWFTLVKPERLRVLAGAGAQTEYQWAPPGQPGAYLHYQFCKTCGIRCFGRGGPGSKIEFYFVNVAALEGLDADEVAGSLHYVDGAQGHYDQTPADTRLM